jgi:hypothetical protein
MTTTVSANAVRARRVLNNMASYIRRPGVTGWVKDRNVSSHYADAFYYLILIEDEEGVEATVGLSERLRKLTEEARAAGLLTPAHIIDGEREAVVRADRQRASKYFLTPDFSERFYLKRGESIISIKDNGDGTAVVLVKDDTASGPFDVYYRQGA